MYLYDTYTGGPNFISANFIYAIFQNFPEKLGLCVYFLTTLGPNITLMK